jgi:hypothetical protein
LTLASQFKSLGRKMDAIDLQNIPQSQLFGETEYFDMCDSEERYYDECAERFDNPQWEF